MAGARWKKVGLVMSFATMISEEAAATHTEVVIDDIENSDELIAPVNRAIQDGKGQQEFGEHLKARIADHDRDIERMCNFHYQGFVDSVGELLHVRAHAKKLKDGVLQTNQSLQKSGNPVIEKAEELHTTRTTLRNITATVDHLQTCLPVLEMYCKLNDQIESKRYYPALKTLEQLEHTYLPRVRRYRFCERMADNIPMIRQNIKEASMSDLKDFLESIRKHSDWIGEEAMKQVQKRSALETSAFSRARHRTVKAESPLTEADKDSVGDFMFEEEEVVLQDLKARAEFAKYAARPRRLASRRITFDFEVSPQDKVDFSPVYRCLHIYSVLGEREVFESYYRKQRTKQSKLAIQPQGNTYDSLDHYKKYFHQILGFFVLEDHVLSTTEGLVTREYLDDLWNTALSKIGSTLRNNSAICTDATLLLHIKNLVVLFVQTVNSYGFNTTTLTEFLLDLKDQYNEILMKKWVQVFRDIFDEDNYTAMAVNSEAEYLDLIRSFPFRDEKIDKAPYPRRLPFSEFVPKVYRQIKEFIYACHKFSQDLHLTQTERDDMIRKSTNVLLTRTLSGCLNALIRKRCLGLTELVQVTVNTIHLENACKYLEDFISNITGTTGDNIHAAGLQSTNIFRDARSEAELEIYRRLNEKVDEFLELATYDWSLDESAGRASGYIIDIIRFLEGSFKAFNHLPRSDTSCILDFVGKVAQTACMSTCKHLASSLMYFLLDSNTRFVSMGAIQQFSLDVIQCEQFANSEPVPGFRDGALQMVFLELRQLLDLFMAWDWSSYFADYGQSTGKYYRVNAQTAINVLEKMRDTDKKKNLFTTFKKNERDRKKLMDTVLKQLKALAPSINNK
ncbi:exocyst complex component 6B isoform X2 [Strongylocentrotus purpuratus]|uniref:Exocyst complex component n=1 Tax=Strongylocentrotus purpuratus TaxID=7668 RepID=A0A7M7NV98_STRPU|nr:exocyst complex component 6B isoform X2 [Strongylocentrotus purpuratus]